MKGGEKVAKVNYRTCDICGSMLEPYRPIGDVTYGYRFLNKLFSRLDICNKCMKKIQLLSIDKEEEQKCVDKLIGNMKKYSNCDCQSAYCEGLEDALSVLSHGRLHWIKINRVK